MTRLLGLAVLLLVLVSAALAGYSIEWQMPLHRASALVYGWHPPDVNGDGLPDLCVSYGSSPCDSVAFFSGITHQRFLSISNIYPQAAGWGVVTANTDADPAPEAVVSWYYTTPPCHFRFRVYDCVNGTCDFESPDFTGASFQIPLLVDIDDDGMTEICLSYGDTLNSTWEAWGWSAGAEEICPPSASGSCLRVVPSVSLAPVIIHGVPASNSPVQISDACGRIVRILATAALGPVPWDGTDDQSRPVTPGCYFVRANGQVVKIMLLP